MTDDQLFDRAIVIINRNGSARSDGLAAALGTTQRAVERGLAP